MGVARAAAVAVLGHTHVAEKAAARRRSIAPTSLDITVSSFLQARQAGWSGAPSPQQLLSDGVCACATQW